MPNRIRGHTRRTASGGTTRVSSHNRKGGRTLISPQHSWKLLRTALKASKRKKKAAAAAYVALGVAEMVGWLALEGLSLALLTAGLLAVGVGVTGAALGGVRK